MIIKNLTMPDVTEDEVLRVDQAATVGGLGERAIVDRIRRRVSSPPSSVLIGIGDDAAVVAPERNENQVLTTDVQIEGVHFDRSFCSPEDIGHKALAVNLSDLAAMGATPRVALLSLALPSYMPVADLDGLLDGLLALADRFGVALVGGNISQSPGPLFVDVTLTGSVRPRRVLTRAGARAGDELYVSGAVGGAAAGLRLLQGARLGDVAEEDAAACMQRYRRPDPRVRLGTLLGRNRVARACVDLSDGLADGVHQLAEASGLGAIVDGESVPLMDGARGVFDRAREDPLRAALTGGEDYELLFAVPPKSRKGLRAVERLVRGLAITRIGVLTTDRVMRLRQAGREDALPAGFAHFG